MNLRNEIPSSHVETVQCIRVEGPNSPHDWFPACFRETETDMLIAFGKTNAQIQIASDTTSILTAALLFALFIVVANVAAFTMINNYRNFQ
jgi:hypothetical protein